MSVSGGDGGIGPQVNKFEHVSSDDHQRSVADRVGTLVPYQGGVTQVPGWGHKYLGPMSGQWETEGRVGAVMSNTSWVMVTWEPREQTDICLNITFPQLRLRAVMIFLIEG